MLAEKLNQQMNDPNADAKQRGITDEEKVIIGQQLFIACRIQKRIADLRRRLMNCFESHWRECSKRDDTVSWWSRVPLNEAIRLVDQIWAFGPRKARTNLLFTRIEGYQEGASVWRCLLQSNADEASDDSVTLSRLRIRLGAFSY